MKKAIYFLILFCTLLLNQKIKDESCGIPIHPSVSVDCIQDFIQALNDKNVVEINLENDIFFDETFTSFNVLNKNLLIKGNNFTLFGLGFAYEKCLFNEVNNSKLSIIDLNISPDGDNEILYPINLINIATKSLVLLDNVNTVAGEIEINDDYLKYSPFIRKAEGSNINLNKCQDNLVLKAVDVLLNYKTK